MEEPSTGECRNCHGAYCARCLVYSFGPKKPPFCVGCALRASGVRSGAKRNMQASKLSVPASEPATFDTAPALFSSHSGHGGPPPPTSGASGSGGGHGAGSTKSSWSQRRAERQAAKAARRSAQQAAAAPASSPAGARYDGGPLAAPAPVELELSAQERRALSRLSQLSAGDLVR
jgi:hypothetical protein